MKNSADLGGCYPPPPLTSVDNTLLDLQNSSYPTKAEFNNCKIYKTAQFTAAPSASLTCLFVFGRIFKDQDFFNAAGFN